MSIQCTKNQRGSGQNNNGNSKQLLGYLSVSARMNQCSLNTQISMPHQFWSQTFHKIPSLLSIWWRILSVTVYHKLSVLMMLSYWLLIFNTVDSSFCVCVCVWNIAKSNWLFPTMNNMSLLWKSKYHVIASQFLGYRLFLSVISWHFSPNLKNSEIWSTWLFHHLYSSHCFQDIESSFFFFNLNFRRPLVSSEPSPAFIIPIRSKFIDFACDMQGWGICSFFYGNLTMLSSQPTTLSM